MGSQLILVNPFCMLAYAYVSFSFFSERIYCEEFMLLKFFGKEYREYQVPIKKGNGSKTCQFRTKLALVSLASWATRTWSGVRGRVSRLMRRRTEDKMPLYPDCFLSCSNTSLE